MLLLKSLFWNKIRVFNFSTFYGLIYRENKGKKWKQIPPLLAIEKKCLSPKSNLACLI
jgi:hypothetical protein